jgi:hypothetical protein
MPPELRNRLAHRWTVPTALGILVVGAALTAGALSAHWGLRPDDAPPAAGGSGAAPSSAALPEDLFRDWPAAGAKKPDMVFILSGQQHSFLKFCGCSRPQLGGFERRYNFMAKLRDRGWPLVSADLGDLVVRSQRAEINPLQDYLKCDIAMKALEILGYAAMTLGADDHLLPLDEGIAQFALQKPNAFPRVLCVNLADKPTRFPHAVNPKQSWIEDWLPAGGKNGVPRVGIVGLTGRSVIQKIYAQNPTIQFLPPDKTLDAMKAVVAQMNNPKEKVDLKLLLFQGSLDEAKKLCGQGLFPDTFDVILCLSDEDTPPARADQAGKTLIVRVGHRGRYLGVVGAYSTGNPAKPFEMYYQSVQMGEEYETAKDKEKNHPILKLLDHYSDEVKLQDFLRRTPQQAVPVPQALAGLALRYVGSDACKSCHQADFAKWKTTKHAHAIDALVKVAEKPRQRQFDSECISCHVVGFGLKSGYDGKPATMHLAGVGCESCHGPGSAHVGAPQNAQFKAAMSPWKRDPMDLLPVPGILLKGIGAMTPAEKAVYLRVNDMCMKCHDTDNDPHFQFNKNWPQIIHGKRANAPIPPPGAAAQNKP